MPRHDSIPAFPKDWEKPPKAQGLHYDIKLITPMFGGGVETRSNDPTFPVRPTAIRGHLQFWWRATVGSKYETAEELRAAQSKIWGSTEQASCVQVLVESVEISRPPQPCATFQWNKEARRGRGAWRIHWQRPFDARRSPLPYVLFPFQGEAPPNHQNAQIEVPPAQCIHQASFRLVLLCDQGIDFEQDVEPALWAWVNFGGLGSRTRRGCGSLYCEELAPKSSDKFKERLETYTGSSSDLRDWPTLAKEVLVEGGFGDAIEAWSGVIGAFQHFRQGVELGRNPGQQPNRPGRSRFPEPESIRRVTGQRCKQPHKQHARQSHIHDDAFPRAELGLPIVFHFKDSNRNNPTDPNSDPRDTVLYPADGDDGQPRERMASPLILKPLALANGQFAPLILQLNTRPLTGVDLCAGKPERSLSLPQTTVLQAARLSTYRDSPLANSLGGSALEAFINYALTLGFQRIP